MRIRFSDHAKHRIKERGIPSKLVLYAIKKPEKTFVSFKTRKLFRKSFRGKILEVVAVEEGMFLEIITAYYLEEQKYES